jgi:predicted RNase H-like HicB family nuclease
MQNSVRYPIVICWDVEQEAYVADVPDIPTCTGSGATYEEALASVLEALHWWKERTHRTKQPRLPQQPDA